MASDSLKKRLTRGIAVIAGGLQALSDRLLSIRFLPVLLFAFIVILSAVFYSGFEKERLTTDANRMLASITDLKARQIVSWRDERLADALYLQKSQEIRGDIGAIIAGDASAFSHLKLIIRPMMASHGYNRIQIYSGRGDLITAEPDVPGYHDNLLEKYFHRIRDKADPLMSDLELDSDGKVTLHMIIPVKNGGGPVGFIVMCVNPYHDLYPLVMSWPVPSKTAESLLVMRTGDEIVYLNELRHRKNSAPLLRLPVSSPDLPAAKAVRGQTGIIDGVDYRGIPVIAEARRIPGSTWHIIVKIDKKEIYAPVREMTIQIIIVVILLIFGFGAVSRNWQFKRELALHRKIRENREMYDLIAEHTSDVVWIVDLDENAFRYVSPSVKSLRGYTAGEVMAQKMSDALTEETIRHLARVIPGRIDELRGGTGGSHIDMIEYRKKDGGTVWAEATTRYIADKATGHIFVYGSSRDITERMKDERLIRSSEAKYRQLIESMRDAIVQIDLDYRIINFNTSFTDLIGYSVEELNQINFMDITPEKWYDTDRRIINEQVLVRGYSDIFEKEYIRKDGTIIPIELRAFLTRDDDGRPLSMWGIVRDISERKKAEEKLRKSEEQFSNIFNSSPIGIAITRMDDGKYINANRAYCDATGYDPDEIIGRTINETGFITGTDYRSGMIDRLRTEGRITNKKITQLSKSGLARFFSVSLVPMELNGEECVVSFIIDITEQREYEKERETTIQILRIINSRNDMNALIHDFLVFMRAFSGCDAVGLRLMAGDDYPYFETQGFSDEFVMLENRLCAYDENGNTIRDPDGNPALECMCGNILRGRFDPSLPFFTENGSFWSNWTSGLLATTTENDRQARTRNRCNGMGYESVALIPVKTENRIIGLIQFNNRKRDAFTPRRIHLFERLAENLAAGIAKRQSDAEVRESRERFSSLFENMLNGFAYCKMLFVDGKPDDFIYINVNHAFETLTGLKNAIGKKVSEVIPGIRESDYTIIERYGRVSLTGVPETFEVYLESLKMWFSVSVYSPEREFFVSVFDVITERKRAEEALVRMNAELEQRVSAGIAELSDLYNKAPCGYHSLDSNGVFERINDTELAWLGYERDEITGKICFRDLLTPESAATFDANFPTFKKTGVVTNLFFEMKRKDGTVLPILLNATAAYDGSGNYRHSRSTIIDYTERKLAEERLRESREKLEEANRDLESFSYSVSHDLRAPLRGIDGWSLALSEDYETVLDEKGRSYLSRVREEAKRMGELIDDMLQLSRVTRERMDIADVDVSALAMSVSKRIGESLPGRSIQFDIQPFIIVRADARLMEILLTNLIDNACKYTVTRQTAVIGIGSAGKDGRSGFFVKDNGVGFDMKYSGRMFGPFQRMHKQSEFPGTGIGLATVKRIISRHGGEIWFETAVDKGFSIYIVI